MIVNVIVTQHHRRPSTQIAQTGHIKVYCGWFSLVLLAVVGGFGWFWLVLGGFGWFHVLVTTPSCNPNHSLKKIQGCQPPSLQILRVDREGMTSKCRWCHSCKHTHCLLVTYIQCKQFTFSCLNMYIESNELVIQCYCQWYILLWIMIKIFTSIWIIVQPLAIPLIMTKLER